MSARRQSLRLLKQLSAAIGAHVDAPARSLEELLELHQNDGDGTFTDESFNAARAVGAELREFKAKVQLAIDLAEATEVGRRRRRTP